MHVRPVALANALYSHLFSDPNHFLHPSLIAGDRSSAGFGNAGKGSSMNGRSSSSDGKNSSSSTHRSAKSGRGSAQSSTSTSDYGGPSGSQSRNTGGRVTITIRPASSVTESIASLTPDPKVDLVSLGGADQQTYGKAATDAATCLLDHDVLSSVSASHPSAVEIVEQDEIDSKLSSGTDQMSDEVNFTSSDNQTKPTSEFIEQLPNPTSPQIEDSAASFSISDHQQENPSSPLDNETNAIEQVSFDSDPISNVVLNTADPSSFKDERVNLNDSFSSAMDVRSSTYFEATTFMTSEESTSMESINTNPIKSHPHQSPTPDVDSSPDLGPGLIDPIASRTDIASMIPIDLTIDRRGSGVEVADILPNCVEVGQQKQQQQHQQNADIGDMDMILERSVDLTAERLQEDLLNLLIPSLKVNVGSTSTSTTVGSSNMTCSLPSSTPVSTETPSSSSVPKTGAIAATSTRTPRSSPMRGEIAVGSPDRQPQVCHISSSSTCVPLSTSLASPPADIMVDVPIVDIVEISNATSSAAAVLPVASSSSSTSQSPINTRSPATRSRVASASSIAIGDKKKLVDYDSDDSEVEMIAVDEVDEMELVGVEGDDGWEVI
ncbi:hypothetical protein HDU76_003435 [Blyttiomyces sp. JEL0837]|nr:hypothetical protein HDU76_003435 [Blyttiomyces sp. JEL0837]